VKADINVTPLVDIVLVLLIIFIVITPAVNNAVRLPVAKHSFIPEKERDAHYLTLILAAHRDAAGAVSGPGTVLVDGKDGRDAQGRPVSFDLADPAGRDRLVGFIQSSVAYLSDRRVFIKADLDLPFRQVNDLFQVCREGGADEASVVTREDKGSGAGGG
jgi:biopolymer transport protein ExbD/biopolymer transport protein TolR